MEIGFIGLGRMGRNIAFNLLSKNVRVVAFNRSPAPLAETAARGATAAASIEDLIKKLKPPRTIWLMVTAGKAVDDIIGSMLPLLDKGDTVIDGGNSFYKDSIRRTKVLANAGVDFLDVGTSGGLEGAAHGACLTVGGKKEAFKRTEPLFKLVSAEGGYAYAGESGAGHFVKMVHNGIEYAVLQSYAEGFELLGKSPYELDLPGIARVWNRGSVIRSWLLELAEKALGKDPRLNKTGGAVGGGETGTWCANTASALNAPADMLALSLRKRLESQKKDTFAGRFVAALRNEFGGHEVKSK